MNAIEIKGLTKSFKAFKAVSDLNINVKENQVFGFLGPNGAGKTTTIRMITGLSKKDKGTIKILGHEVNFGSPETHRYFGYLPENPSIYGWMTGEEFLKFCCELQDIERVDIPGEVKRLLELAGLTDAKKKRVGSYSNGMKQRLGIAQALVGDPKVLILDEPVSALDPLGRREVLSVIEKLKKKKTIFMSTHILADVDRVCDEVAILKDGKLLVQSSLAELKTKYAVPILEVEFLNPPTGVEALLAGKKWVKKYEILGNTVKIWLLDDKGVKDNTIFKLFATLKNGILKYGLILPEAEDLFVKIVGEAK